MADVAEEWPPAIKKRKKGEPLRRKPRNRSYSRNFLRQEIIQGFATQNAEHEAKAAELNLGWQLRAATIVERYPVVMPDEPDWARDYRELAEYLEYFDHHDWPEGLGPLHPDKTDVSKEKDLEIPFELASRTTAADAANDTTSLERALTHSLYLCLEHPGGGGGGTGTGLSGMGLPEVALNEGEMLGMAAERAIEACVADLPALFHFRRQPFGHVVTAFDESSAEATEHGLYGAKTFLYSAAVVNPYPTHIFAEGGEKRAAALPPFQRKVQWLTKAELCTALAPPVGRYLEHLLYAETPFNA